MTFAIASVVGAIVILCFIRFGYVWGRAAERARWKQRGHSIWDQERR